MLPTMHRRLLGRNGEPDQRPGNLSTVEYGLEGNADRTAISQSEPWRVLFGNAQVAGDEIPES